MKKIPLTQGKFALVDDEDFNELNRLKWKAHRGHRDNYYATKTVYLGGGRADQKSGIIQMHRVILGLTDPSVIVDHIDGNGLNNQRGNLRLATASQNLQNTRKRLNCSSEYKGVYYDKENKKWRASIKHNGKVHRLGRFEREIEAAKAYNAKASEVFGEFAKLNTLIKN